ncbi:unnamed protein product [Lactuca virosa]|uniref:Uncharacterized protein n=1 Tax=Lactuca virosa TaxID=75947 RepID=A0AAU9MYA2_9ASTR|nr:unnamed protein product [Lactuca virosa]
MEVFTTQFKIRKIILLLDFIIVIQEHSTTDPSLLNPLTDSSHVLLSSMKNGILDDDEEIVVQAFDVLSEDELCPRYMVF